MTQERRKFVRINKTFKISYHVVQDYIKGETKSRNISEGGVCLPLDRYFCEGTILETEIHCAEINNVPIKALVRLVWITHKHVGKLLFEAGFQFLEIDAGERDKLRDYIKRVIAQEQGGAKGVRWIE